MRTRYAEICDEFGVDNPVELFPNLYIADVLHGPTERQLSDFASRRIARFVGNGMGLPFRDGMIRFTKSEVEQVGKVRHL